MSALICDSCLRFRERTQVEEGKRLLEMANEAKAVAVTLPGEPQLTVKRNLYTSRRAQTNVQDGWGTSFRIVHSYTAFARQNSWTVLCMKAQWPPAERSGTQLRTSRASGPSVPKSRCFQSCTSFPNCPAARTNFARAQEN